MKPGNPRSVNTGTRLTSVSEEQAVEGRPGVKCNRNPLHRLQRTIPLWSIRTATLRPMNAACHRNVLTTYYDASTFRWHRITVSCQLYQFDIKVVEDQAFLICRKPPPPNPCMNSNDDATSSHTRGYHRERRRHNEARRKHVLCVSVALPTNVFPSPH